MNILVETLHVEYTVDISMLKGDNHTKGYSARQQLNACSKRGCALAMSIHLHAW